MNIWISASHIPGSKNVEADKESRKINDSTEWSLSMTVYNRLAQLWGPFQVDLFGLILRSQIMCHGDQILATCLLMPFS